MEKKLLEETKLICEYMGGIVNKYQTEVMKMQGESILLDHCEFHCSWDWLMPVMDRIITKNVSCGYFGAPGYAGETYITDILNDQMNGVNAKGSTLFEAMYKAVITHIIEENEKKKS